MLENNIHQGQDQYTKKEKALETYQKYIHESKNLPSVSRLKLEPQLQAFNELAGEDIFEIIKVRVSGDARTFYKLAPKAEAFSYSKKVA